MNTKVSYRYQLSTHIKPIAIFYLIVFCINAFLFTASIINLTAAGDDSITGSISGMEFASTIFIFVASLNSFREEFSMLMQNGVSRKSLFTGRILTALSVALGMSVIDTLISFICKAAANLTEGRIGYYSLFEMVYNDYAIANSTLLTKISSFAFNTSLYLLATAVGYIITIIFYRLGKNGKLALSIGTPVGLFVILPTIDSTITKGKIFSALFNILNTAFGVSAQRPLNALITSSLTFIILSALGWLLIRRSYVKD